MTRYGYDALYPERITLNIPAGSLLLAYLGHDDNPASYEQAVERFPDHQVISISSTHVVDAQVLDVEYGAVDPGAESTIVNWCAAQRARGVCPTIYCNTSTYPMVAAYPLGEHNWWAANWSHGPTIPDNAVGVQYTGMPNAYDVSIFQDFIPGFDQPKDEEMKLYIAIYQGAEWIVDPGFQWRTHVQMDVPTLLNTGNYIDMSTSIPDVQMACIPVVSAVAIPGPAT